MSWANVSHPQALDAKVAAVPDRISRINELARDLWWTWHPPVREVFRRLDYMLWRVTAHNPVLMLRVIGAKRLEEASQDPEFLQIYDSAVRLLRKCPRG
jgi:starch phosphorylase